MAIIKCKMCGGDLEITEGVNVAECEYCGSKQTIPTVDNEKKLTLFSRANRLRFACEFDKAAGVYEALVADFPEEAEAYWGLVLCKYGIEYVDDPGTGKKIPTCHRSSFESVMDDGNFEMVMEFSDAAARRVYREEAKQIEELRKGIIEVSGKEEPYDIFICCKETDETGSRTLDSVLAQDVYDALTDKGYRVFFSRITLEDKLGQEYEPCIFAALNSAKIMLAFGTDFEYINAVWVRNEWSRYLQLMTEDKSKHLIPCYKGIDAYDMPKEFAKLQAQDMGKVGAVQDLMRGIEKLMPKTKETVINDNEAFVAPLLRRVSLFLEEGKWDSADQYCEKVLDLAPENAHAYLGKLMAQLKIRTQQSLKDSPTRLELNDNFNRAVQFAEPGFKEELLGYAAHISERMARTVYNRATMLMSEAASDADYWEAAKQFQTIGGYRDAASLAQVCMEQADALSRDLDARQQYHDQLAETYQQVLAAKQEIDQLKVKLKKSEADHTDTIEQIQRSLRHSAKNLATKEGVEAELSEVQAALSQLIQQTQTKTEELQGLTQRRQSLGFFAGREKKELTAQIEALAQTLEKEKRQCESMHSRVSGLNSQLETWVKIIQSNEELAQREQKIEEEWQKQSFGIRKRIAELERFLKQNEGAAQIKAKLDLQKAGIQAALCQDEYAGRTDESVGSFYVCTKCQDAAPDHVCIITPERPGACGAVSWAKAKDGAEQDPNGPILCIPKGLCTDSLAGHYTEVDKAVEKYTNGAVTSVNLYSLFRDPMTAADDFECVCGAEPLSMGVVIACPEYNGITPLGMRYSEMVSMTGGGIQTPGFMGHSKSYIFSKKFIAAEGGPARIVWMPSRLKNEIRDQLDATALELYGIKWFTNMIADETICGDDPEELLTYLSNVNHPVLGMEPFDF